MPASGQRPRRQRRLTDRERDGSSRSESFWARMHPQTKSGGTTEGGPRFWSQLMPGPRVLLEVTVLLRKMQEPLAVISKETRRAEESLFLRLEELARDRPCLFDGAMQQLAEDEFVAVLSDHDFGAEVSAWSGAADGIVVAFEAWLNRNTRVRHAPHLIKILRESPQPLRTIQQSRVSRSIAVSAFGRMQRLAHSMLSVSSSG